MRILSLNVNGLKSSLNKGLEKYLLNMDYDIICLQEIKCNSPLLNLDGYYSYYNYCKKNGYSGTAIFTKFAPINENNLLSNVDFDLEGRIIILEYKAFYLINVYVPNSKANLSRINYRMNFDGFFYQELLNLDRKKPIIVCGDFNVDYETNELIENSEISFEDNEIEEFCNFLDSGFIDTFRELHKNLNKKNTWFLMGKNNTKKDIGYRLDYFIVSNYLKQFLIDSKICEDTNCSDHYPIELEIDLKV